MKKYPVEKSFYVFASFAAVGGFLEAYTYLLHGGVFCNAQTGNLVLLAMNLFAGNFAPAAHYAYSILAYLAGIFVSVILSKVLKGTLSHVIVTAAELAAFVALAFVPAGASDWYTYVSVAFLCALQYNVFTECRGAALSTTFCTNNLRQATINLYRGAAEKDKQKLKKSGIYALVILFSWLTFCVVLFKDPRFTLHYLESEIECRGLTGTEARRYLDEQHRDYERRLAYGNFTRDEQRRIDQTFAYLYNRYPAPVRDDLNARLDEVQSAVAEIAGFTRQRQEELEQARERETALQAQAEKRRAIPISRQVHGAHIYRRPLNYGILPT